MFEPARERQLDKTLAALEAVGVVPHAAKALDAGVESVKVELRQSILAEVPAYSASGNPDVLPELGHHSSQHIHEIRRLLNGAVRGDFKFVREHARHRAEQKFPLEATLHAYRCGHKVLARWMREAALASIDHSIDERQVVATVADFAIEYTDTVSTIATSEYVAQTRRLVEAEGDRRTELMSVLLSGYDESDGRVANLLRRAGYLEQRQSFCVAVVQSVDPKEMDNPARVRRLSESLRDALQTLGARSLIGMHDNRVTVIISDTRRVSGWTTPQTTLVERVKPYLLKTGNSVLTGLSVDVPSTSYIPKALVEAQMALEFADMKQRVMQFSDIPVRRLLLHLAEERIQPALPPWCKRLLDADSKGRGVLTTTLRAYADADMNVLQAAKQLAVHPNTIYARMQKITAITGLNALGYHALTELLLATDSARRY